ncbi:hypothetical protein multiple PEST sequences [Meleagrid alphaherpesvirus 1]|uniref:Uncharacterized protein HVT070 n=1 Tax=Meleagrid herpesvirus 1 TaxID=37108 RepID=Q9DPP6_MEHV1|nr:membrane protein UL56 [Meleagrid alphaherpesvirus 1]AAG45800.1 hypothetical protein multiple PEST sequences [Meleagrid alphaherpesvirus 1]
MDAERPPGDPENGLPLTTLEARHDRDSNSAPIEEVAGDIPAPSPPEYLALTLSEAESIFEPRPARGPEGDPHPRLYPPLPPPNYEDLFAEDPTPHRPYDIASDAVAIAILGVAFVGTVLSVVVLLVCSK